MRTLAKSAENKPSSNSQRNSSVELFRIIATFLVLIVHFNGWFVGGMPKYLLLSDAMRVSQAIIAAFSCICVNCFLVITGWYGLKFKWKHVWTIWSILVWIYVPLYLITCVNTNTFSIKVLLLDILAVTKESYYVQCYLMLLFLSPVLNAFIQRYKKRILPFTLAFWGIEIIFDWMLQNQCLGFGRGYMLTHFVFMYLLGQTVFMFRDNISKCFTVSRSAGIYLLGIIIITAMYVILPSNVTFVYTNPVNVIISFVLFLSFERKFFHNKVINWIAESTLAVYILHITPPIINTLQKWDVYAFENYNYFIYLGLMLATIIIVFICGILYDKIRTLFMPNIGRIVCRWISSKTDKYSLN